MRATCNKGLFYGVKIGNGDPLISHLFYADDAIFVGEWSQNNLKNLARILRCFHITSGLKVNFHKSKVFGIGISQNITRGWANLLGCVARTLPFNYLGVSVGANMNHIKNWQPIVDMFNSKLSTWKAKTLSFGGRLTLINSVLGNIPTYYLSLFKAPCEVTNSIEKLRRQLLWG